MLNKFMEYLECGNLSEDLDYEKFRIIKCTIINLKFEDNLILLQGKHKNIGLIGLQWTVRL